MGIDTFSAKFLMSESRRGVAFERLLTLGRQSIYMERGAYRALITAAGGSAREENYADDLFRALGAAEIDVMDTSPYEGANVIHDLNQPVNSDAHGRYDCVFDGGTLEHVFDFPTALKSCLEMVKQGGWFITITPANQFCGHGFYQFSPELFYSALSPASGFNLERMLFVYRNHWYSIRKPAEVKSRIELFTDEPISLFISARRCEQKSIFHDSPQQSDYVQCWSQEPSGADTLTGKKRSMKEMLLDLFPRLRPLQAGWRTFKRRRQCSPFNTDWFTPVRLDEV
jgi:hypothetical protein